MQIESYKQLEEVALSEGHRGIDGVPSCSRLPQLELCPGSMAAIRAGMSQVNDGNAAADMGTIIHKAMELNHMPADAPVEALEKYNFMQDKRKALREAGWEDWLTEDYFELAHDLQPILTGAVDCVMAKRGPDGQVVEALVIDYKTGKGRVSPTSPQLQAYCLMVEQRYRREIHNDCKWHIYVLQPAHPNNRIVAIDIDEAHDLVYGILERSQYGQGGPRIPGTKQCKYCNAHDTSTCPETQSTASLLAANGEL